MIMSDSAFQPAFRPAFQPAFQSVPLMAAHAGFSPFRPMLHGQRLAPLTAVQAEPVVDAYAQGVQDGQEMAAAAFAVEQAHYQALLCAAEAIQTGDSEELAQLIGEAVCALTCQIVEKAPIDADWLKAQAHKAAAMIGDYDAARTLRLHPEDLALIDTAELPLAVQADANLARGELRIDGSAGWIEHGRSSYLNALRAALSAGDAA